MEHHSNLVPWQLLAQEKDADLEFVPFDDEGRLLQDVYEVLLRTNPKLVTFTAVSNGLGHDQPDQEMIRKAHEVGALVLIDGAQAVPHEPVNVQDLDCDFFVFSGHKTLGPPGSGALWARREILEDDAAVHGRWRDDPRGQAAPLDVATRCPASSRRARRTSRRPSASARRSTTSRALGMEDVRAHEQELVEYALDGAAASACPASASTARTRRRSAPAIITFNLADAHPHDVATLLDREAIAIRAGHHCTMPLHQRLGEEASARASFYVYTDRDDIDRLADALNKVERLFAPRPAAQ